MESYFEAIDGKNFRVYWDFDKNRLILPSEFTADPETQYTTVLPLPAPYPSLHNLSLGGKRISFFDLDIPTNTLVQKTPYYGWLHGFNTPAFLSYASSFLYGIDTLKLGVVSRFGGISSSLDNMKGLVQSINVLRHLVLSETDEIRLRTPPGIHDLIRSISDGLIARALE